MCCSLFRYWMCNLFNRRQHENYFLGNLQLHVLVSAEQYYFPQYVCTASAIFCSRIDSTIYNAEFHLLDTFCFNLFFARSRDLGFLEFVPACDMQHLNVWNGPLWIYTLPTGLSQHAEKADHHSLLMQGVNKASKSWKVCFSHSLYHD